MDHPEWVVAIYGSTTSEPCVLSKPTIDDESLRFVLKLAVPGRYRLLRSTDLVNWTSVDEFEASVDGQSFLRYQIEGRDNIPLFLNSSILPKSVVPSLN